MSPGPHSASYRACFFTHCSYVLLSLPSQEICGKQSQCPYSHHFKWFPPFPLRSPAPFTLVLFASQTLSVLPQHQVSIPTLPDSLFLLVIPLCSLHCLVPTVNFPLNSLRQTLWLVPPAPISRLQLSISRLIPGLCLCYRSGIVNCRCLVLGGDAAPDSIFSQTRPT